MSCKIDVLQRVRDMINIHPDHRVNSTLKMAASKIESLERNQGFRAELRAKIASEQMAMLDEDLSFESRAKYAVRAADALLKELAKNDNEDNASQ